MARGADATSERVLVPNVLQPAPISDTVGYRHGTTWECRHGEGRHGDGDNGAGTATAGAATTEDRPGHRVLGCNARSVWRSRPTVRQRAHRQFAGCRPGGGDQRPNPG